LWISSARNGDETQSLEMKWIKMRIQRERIDGLSLLIG
jgi:hypothetical protein